MSRLYGSASQSDGSPQPTVPESEVTIARAEREKAAQDPVIQALARRLGVPVHFLLDYRERVIGQFDPHLDRTTKPRRLLVFLVKQRFDRCSSWAALGQGTSISFPSMYRLYRQAYPMTESCATLQCGPFAPCAENWRTSSHQVRLRR